MRRGMVLSEVVRKVVGATAPMYDEVQLIILHLQTESASRVCRKCGDDSLEAK